MRLVIQRVSEAAVVVDQKIVSEIGNGLMILAGIEAADNEEDIAWLVKKILQLRIFDDNAGVMNLSILETGGSIMFVSQFTLHANIKKGNRPSYIRAARPEIAVPLYNKFVGELESGMGKQVKTGIFGVHMYVSMVNDGPVTIILDSKNKDF